MSDNEGCGFIIILIIIIYTIIFSIGMYSNGKYDGYKEGQIDAINGIIKFQLVEKENKTKNWEEIIKNK